jgi:hypothetical protein
MAISLQDREWWVRPESMVEEEDPIAHEKLKAVMSHLLRDQGYRKRAHVLHAAMYGNNNIIQYDSRTRPGTGSNLSLNVSRNMVDAVTSRIAAKSRPKLSYVTEGGDYEKQHNALQLERGVEGLFYTEKYYAKSVNVFRDACAMGTGFIRIEPNYDDRCVSFGRWKPWEVILDDGEALYQGDGAAKEFDDWKSFYTVRYYDRASLAYKFREEPDKQRDILQLDDTYDDDVEFGRQSAAVRVLAYEAWHKPSGREATNGRHVMGVKNGTLVDKLWDPRKVPHPFASFLWSDPIAGTYYGQGLIELLMGMQTEVNKLVREIQNGHHLICGHWLVERGSKVVLAHINNDLSRILQYTGQVAPQYVAPAIIAPEVYQHLWALVAKMYEIAGINQQTAQAQKPQGLDSGEAQRVYADQQTETLLEKGQRFDDFVLDCGTRGAAAARLLAKTGKYEVRAMADDAFDTIDWKSLDDPDGYEARIAAVSSLPGTPAGKINLATDLQKLGEFDSGDILEVIGMADTLQITRRKQSSRKRTEKVVGEMLRLGKSYEPDMFFRLKESAIIAAQMLNEAETKEPPVPDDRLQLVRDFVVKCIKLAKDLEAAGNPLQPPPPAPPAPPQPPPGGQPMPAPQPAPQPAPPQRQAA